MHVLFLLLMAAAIVVPIARILRRLGRHPAWALLVLFPPAGLIGLWVLAYSEWPGVVEKRPELPDYH
ncbi:MAG TPA: hypothetical protein VL966_07925 [Alphaproteobacteria bacterium]|jgi:hypothetical protein|nr:hypothetical protein [Alphaproteobacteria bacterium]